MLEEIVPFLKSFRDRIYRFFPSRRDAAMELVDALSSNKTASSVVELSVSPLHRPIIVALRGFWMSICQKMLLLHINNSMN